jgi:hypothetical protein
MATTADVDHSETDVAMEDDDLWSGEPDRPAVSSPYDPETA